ncbi:MAG: FIST C-terminal domain-containing protein [Methylacidiphilales bacterium]|nr:FIST C-terminal domain-containing protein [Candidatus Methylacidiphilales bacterium]MDW8349048.1 FIST N-terminal domain-containing protein [Verrucomicrobiae bacterium]
MKIEIRKFSEGSWENVKGSLPQSTQAQLVIAFGDTALLKEPQHLEDLRTRYPQAQIIGCSTSGNIADTTVDEGTIVATAIYFEHTQTIATAQPIPTVEHSSQVGKTLVETLLQHPDLRHIFILAEGLHINGSLLVEGANAALAGRPISITGGLAGDGTRFSETLTIFNGTALPRQVVAIGFYGQRIKVNHGCVHGWETFGVNRKITKSIKNVVYEIDGEPALKLYKSYLGEEHAKNLPASGLRFPLMIHQEGSNEPLIRTLLAVDETTQSLTFAGDVPEGNVAVLMKTNIDGLIEAAGEAARQANLQTTQDALAIAISCVGRRLVLTKLVEEEICAVQDTLGDQFYLTGFYSYGELAPNMTQGMCNLHNQTMTLTTFSEE